MRTLDIFFDVDYTILGLDGSLRPWTREVFERLRAEGHRVHVWSGAGDRSAVLREHGIEHLVEACYRKPLANHEASLDAHGVPLTPDFVVDDHPEIPAIFGGALVAAYTAGTPSDYFPRERDEELLRACEAARDFAATGASADPRYCAKGSRVRR
ncbi:MAG: hypothetical protein F4Z25_01625 [Chloroflexi bacterium]|nr:hypothetical protein [Chloroflexota bacterium]MYE47527.1 hypothetical protein [Chloroflexota bacterium]